MNEHTLRTMAARHWHLLNIGQSQVIPSTGQIAFGTIGNDLNVLPVWLRGIRGNNVTIAIVDDGIQGIHSDLQYNYASEHSFDFDTNTRYQEPQEMDNHGTSCAGVAVARSANFESCVTGNSTSCCAWGVAFEAKVAAIRVISQSFTDRKAAEALVYHANEGVSIYSASWGPPDDGVTLERYSLSAKAIEYGTEYGRQGKGSIYVWAAGNGKHNLDESNYDELANHRYTICVSSTDWNGVHSAYSEIGPNILVNAPSSTQIVDARKKKHFTSLITTTDRMGICGFDSTSNCYYKFGGTSSSAPVVAGIVALALQANPNLTWRDVQHALVETAVRTDKAHFDWKSNAAGKNYSRYYGFGRVDADSLIRYVLNMPQPVCMHTWKEVMQRNVSVLISNFASMPTLILFNVSNTLLVEYVQIRITTLTAKGVEKKSNLVVAIRSPHGTMSVITEGRLLLQDLIQFRFSSLQFWGEQSRNVTHSAWYVAIYDKMAQHVPITLEQVELSIYGLPPHGTECKEQHSNIDEPMELWLQFAIALSLITVMAVSLCSALLVFFLCTRNCTCIKRARQREWQQLVATTNPNIGELESDNIELLVPPKQQHGAVYYA